MLNDNQINFRATKIVDCARKQSPETDEVRVMMEIAMKSLGFDTAPMDVDIDAPDGLPEDFDDKFVSIMKKQVEKGNPQWARVWMDYSDKQAAKDFIKHLQIEILDYRIKDASLRQIILEAPDDIVKECRKALLERDVIK